MYVYLYIYIYIYIYTQIYLHEKRVIKFNLKLFGGDLSSSKNIFMSVTILGLVSKKFHKNMIANEGSEIFVSDTLGDAGIGLQIKKGKFSKLKKSEKFFFLSKFNTPIPQIKLGESLVGIADFCKDISDGFFFLYI